MGHIVIDQKAQDHLYSPSKDLQELSHSVEVVSLIDEPTKNTFNHHQYIEPASMPVICNPFHYCKQVLQWWDS